METKFIEIRDIGTRIAALAMRMLAQDETEFRFMRHSGFSQEYPSVILMGMDDQKATCDPYNWCSLGMGMRTRQNAHIWICGHWDEIESGQVVDVQVILGETVRPKRPEIGMAYAPPQPVVAAMEGMEEA